MMFSSCTKKTEIKSWPQKSKQFNLLVGAQFWPLVGSKDPLNHLVQVKVDVKKLDYHYTNKQTRTFSRMIVQTVTLHKNTSWQERMNSSRVTTPSLFLSIFWREKWKHISAVFVSFFNVKKQKLPFVLWIILVVLFSCNYCFWYLEDLETVALLHTTWCLK